MQIVFLWSITTDKSLHLPTGVGIMQHYVETGKTREEIIKAATKMCMSFKIETPRVCMGVIHLMMVSLGRDNSQLLTAQLEVFVWFLCNMSNKLKFDYHFYE